MQGCTGNTLQNLFGSSRNCIAHLYQLQVFPFQSRIFIAQFTRRNDLSGFQRLRIARIGNDFFTPNTVIFVHEVSLVDNLLFQESSIARIENLNLTHHLTNNHLEVLIVNLHTLHTVHILNFVHDIFLYSRRTFDGQDIGRSNGSIGKRSSGTHVIVLLYQYLFGKRNQIFLRLTRLGNHRDFTITTFHFPEDHLTVDFRNDSRIRRVTCFEQLGYTRKTTGNVTGFTDRTRYLNEYISRFNPIAVFNHQVSSHRQSITLDYLPGFIENLCRRYTGTVFRFDNDLFFQTRLFVRFYTISNTFFHGFEVDSTAHLRNNYRIEGVPFANHIAFLNGIAIVEEKF